MDIHNARPGRAAFYVLALVTPLFLYILMETITFQSFVPWKLYFFRTAGMAIIALAGGVFVTNMVVARKWV